MCVNTIKYIIITNYLLHDRMHNNENEKLFIQCKLTLNG